MNASQLLNKSTHGRFPFFPNTKCMSKIKEYPGIDISNDVSVVADESEQHHQFKNDPSGFNEFSKLLCENFFSCVRLLPVNITKLVVKSTSAKQQKANPRS